MVAVASVLRPELESDQLQHLVDREWERESQGMAYISETQLHRSLYELVDVWTPDIKRSQYVQFLVVLKFKAMVALKVL